MRRFWMSVAMILAGVLAASTAVVAQDDKARAKAMLEKVDDLWRADASYAVMVMHVKTANYERQMEMEAWSKGKRRSLVKISKPRKEKGTATLLLDGAIHTYLPKTDRTIRISAGMMSGSWMGSHFTNDDLVKSSRLSEDYTHAITFEGQRQGRTVIDITLTPLPEAAVMWDRVELTLDAAEGYPIEQRFFDEDGQVARTMTFSEVRNFNGRTIPSVMKVSPRDKPGEYTQITYKKLELGAKVPDRTFSMSNLKR